MKSVYDTLAEHRYGSRTKLLAETFDPAWDAIYDVIAPIVSEARVIVLRELKVIG